MSDQEYGKHEDAAQRRATDDELETDERLMRQTLGLDGRGRRPMPSPLAKPRHRFVQDGDVPVIHLATPRDGDTAATARGRIAALEAALLVEQSARAKAEHATQAALSQLHAVETKLAHAEMAGQEAVAAERRAREQAETALQQALAARPEPDAAVKKVRRPRTTTPLRSREPQPVKWWLGKKS